MSYPYRVQRAAGWTLFAVLSGTVVPSDVAAPAQSPRPLGPGTHKVLTHPRVNGFRRSYFVHVPPLRALATPRPVILALHGAFSTARSFERETGLSELADREGFLVIYPQGIGLFDLLRHWNSGHCCGKARKMNLDDVDFVLGAVDDVALQLPVDRSRIYVMGYSNGGMLAYRIAAERSDVVAAVAAISATVGGSPSADEPEWVVSRPARPVPVLAVHGRDDESVPYAGGSTVKSRGKNSTISVARSIGLWIDADGCESQPLVERMHGGRVERKTWSACGADSEVTLYSLDGWGHDWPGGQFLEQLPQDDPLRQFAVTEIVWRFFERQRRTR